MYKVYDFVRAVNELAPFAAAEDWDNTGLLIGNGSTAVHGVIVALDVTAAVLAQAKLHHANLIITHHPVIFPSVNRIDGLLYECVAAKMCVICAHTNLDSAQGGVNDALAKRLELQEITAPVENGPLRVGKLKKPMQAAELAVYVKEKLQAAGVRYMPGGEVSAVAVCGGAGGDLWQQARLHGAQALISAEIKHHVFLQAQYAGFTLVDAGHYATEAVVLPELRQRLRALLPDVTIGLCSANSICGVE